MPQPRAGRGGEVCRAQHPGWQMGAHRRIDYGKSGKARMLGRLGREVEPGSPRPAQRTRKGKLQPRQAANRLKIAERLRPGLTQHSADRDRQRVSVHAAEEPAGKPGGHADHARYLHAMVAVSGGLKASLVPPQGGRGRQLSVASSSWLCHIATAWRIVPEAVTFGATEPYTFVILCRRRRRNRKMRGERPCGRSTSEMRPALPAQLADLGRKDGCRSSRPTAMLASDSAERIAGCLVLRGWSATPHSRAMTAARRRRVGIA